uniref:Uncharacterized protein n=1 Tax=Leersia perrieri TaxID=77586 RepID=A0A0D9Y0A2_9ORYZ
MPGSTGASAPSTSGGAGSGSDTSSYTRRLSRVVLGVTGWVVGDLLIDLYAKNGLVLRARQVFKESGAHGNILEPASAAADVMELMSSKQSKLINRLLDGVVTVAAIEDVYQHPFPKTHPRITE